MPKSLGQHFLKNKTVVQKIITALDPQPNETIVEIGPGHGALTIPLVEAAGKVGARVIAVEKDATLAQMLENKTRDGESSAVEIVAGDALDFLKGPCLGPRIDKIVGNIPYYITGHLLRTIGELKTRPRITILMVQKEVAERACAAPPKMNRLAASLQYWAELKIIATVPKTEFSPVPKVDSAVIKLETISPQPENSEKYYATVRTLFAQPRKMVLNNLAADPSGKKDKNELITILQSAGVSPTARPQNLTIENIRAIATKI